METVTTMTGDINYANKIKKADNKPNLIIFNIPDGPAILKISREGFYVRGVLLPQDADEAKAVHEAFLEWMRESGAWK